MAPRAELPRASNFNDLNCQPDVKARFDRQRVFTALSNLSDEQDDRRFQVDQCYDAPGPVVPDIYAQLGAKSRLLPNPFLELGPIEREDKAAAETIKIILRPVNRRGRSRASLPGGTVLVASSRHPYLDAARILIAAGYDPDSWLEGWRPGTKAFASRARLGIAARLTIDETKNSFAKWKAFPQSAASSSIDYSQAAGTTLAPGVDGSCSLRGPY